MSECVVRMEMPKRCYECDMADGITCMATGGVYGREVPKMTWIRRRHDWCPIICQLPEGHGRLADKDLLMRHLDFLNTFGRPDDGKELSYEDFLVTIDDFPTIVPAEPPKEDA